MPPTGRGSAPGAGGRLTRWVGARDCPPPLTGHPTNPTTRRTLWAHATWTARGPALITVPELNKLRKPATRDTHLLAVGPTAARRWASNL